MHVYDVAPAILRIVEDDGEYIASEIAAILDKL